MNEKIKIYVLHYGCGKGDLLVTCRNTGGGKGCDLCDLKTRMYYEVMEVDKDELYDFINNSAGNYVHISTVKPDDWMSKEEYEAWLRNL